MGRMPTSSEHAFHKFQVPVITTYRRVVQSYTSSTTKLVVGKSTPGQWHISLAIEIPLVSKCIGVILGVVRLFTPATVIIVIRFTNGSPIRGPNLAIEVNAILRAKPTRGDIAISMLGWIVMVKPDASVMESSTL